MRPRTSRLVRAAAAAVYLFLHVPLLTLVVFSFNESRFSVAWSGFTLDWYARLFAREDILEGLGRSLLVGAVATVLSTALGTGLALALGRHRVPGRRAMEGLLYLPLVTPEVIMGISLLSLFAAVGVPLGLATITIAHVAFCISFVAVVVAARLRGMDRHLEEAALVLGADEWSAFWRVTFPGLWPGIAAGALLAFTMSFDDYVITSFVSGAGSSTLPVVIYGMARRGVEPTVNAVSTIVVALTAVLLYVADRVRAERPAGAPR